MGFDTALHKSDGCGSNQSKTFSVRRAGCLQQARCAQEQLAAIARQKAFARDAWLHIHTYIHACIHAYIL